MKRRRVHVVADGCSTVVNHLGEGNIRLGYAISPELFESFALELDVSHSALAGFFKALEREAVPVERLDEELRRIAENYQRLRAQIRAFSSSDLGVRGLISEAERLVDFGALDEAMRILLEAQSIELARADIARKNASNIAAMRADIEMTQLEYGRAVETLREAIKFLPRSSEEGVSYLERISEAERLNGRLSQALEAADDAVALAEGMARGSRARPLRLRAKALRELGKYEMAEVTLELALKEVSEEPTVYQELLIDRAALMLDQGRVRRAKAAFEEIRRSLEVQSPYPSLEIARILQGIGRTCFEVGDWLGATKAFDRSLDILRKKLPQDHPATTRVLSDLGLVFLRTGNLDRAEEIYEEAGASLLRVHGTGHPEFATNLDQRAGLALERADYLKARDLYDRALSLAVRKLGPRHPDAGQAWNNLGCVKLEMGEVSGARTAFLESLGIFAETLGTRHPDYADALHNLASVELMLGDMAVAEAHCEESLAIRLEKFGNLHQASAHSFSLRGSLNQAAGRLDNAEMDYRTALNIWITTFGIYHVTVSQSYSNLARVYLDQQDAVHASNAARRALRTGLKSAGRQHPTVATALNNLGHAEYLKGRYRRAAKLLEIALSIRRTLHCGDHPEVATCLANLAVVMSACGEIVRASEVEIEFKEMEQRLSGRSAGHH